MTIRVLRKGAGCCAVAIGNRVESGEGNKTPVVLVSSKATRNASLVDCSGFRHLINDTSGSILLKTKSDLIALDFSNGC